MNKSELYNGAARVVFPVTTSAWSLNHISTVQPPRLVSALLILVAGAGGFASSYHGVELLAHFRNEGVDLE